MPVNAAMERFFLNLTMRRVSSASTQITTRRAAISISSPAAFGAKPTEKQPICLPEMT
jgi:hypothetical protein